MKKEPLLILSLLMFSISVLGQYEGGITVPDSKVEAVKDLSDWSYKLSTTINSSDIKEHIFILASDEYEGRETGTPGNTKAANYIARQFEKLGFPKVTKEGYFQPVYFTFTSWDELTLSVGGNDYKLLRDFIAFPQESFTQSISADEIIFLGYGIDDAAYSDYDIDVKDKVVMVYDGEPVGDNGTSYITGTKTPSKWAKDWKIKSTLAKEKGSKMLIIVSNDLKTLINDNRRMLVNRVTQLGNKIADSDQTVNTIFLSSKVAEDILGAGIDSVIEARDMIRDGKKASMSMVLKNKTKAKFSIKKDVLEGNNILGYIEGTDLKDELVIVSAHYDHIGKKGDAVYNGADDNASGTTGLLEIAEAFATAKKLKQNPRRSVLFLLVTGEEKGLLGSEYYANNPIYSIENTIVDVNVDMIGRWGEHYPAAQSKPYIYVIGSDRISQDLHDINEDLNQKYGHLTLDYTYNDENDPNRFYFRSDHYNFAKKGIPSIFFFNGVHDDYHRLSDTPDKIDLSLLRDRARHIFHLVWDLANREDRIRKNTQK